MRIIALETAVQTGSIAVWDADDQQDPIKAIRLPPELRTAQSLAPAAAEQMSLRDWTFADLELVCVATGPGSFTGLRIGVTMAKTLAYLTGAKLVGVHSLVAMAAACDRSNRLWTVLDAGRRQLFVARFEPQTNLANAVPPETKIYDLDAWLAMLQTGDAVCGPLIEKLQDRLPARVSVTGHNRLPTAAEVGQVGFAMFANGATIDPLALTPNYCRQSAAEEKAEEKARAEGR